MTHERDPIIDPLLEETLGGQQPPDLTARILAAWAEQQLPTGQTIVPPPLPVSPALPIFPTKRRRRSQSSWMQIIVSLSATAALLIAGFFGLHQPPVKPVAKMGPAATAKIAQAPSPPLAKQTPRPATKIAPVPKTPSLNATNELAKIETPEPAKGPSSPTISPPIPAPDTKPTVNDAEIVSFVNLQLNQAWQKAHVSPAPAANDAELCRRLFVRILGRIPTIGELQAYEKDRAPEKYERLVDRLLSDSQYTDEFAKHWATVWANVLLGRGVGVDRDELASREGLEQYLREAFAQNKPFDRLVTELLTATGTGEPGADNFNGAANYLLACLDDRGIAATASICRVFLGVQLQCAQCHNHPTEPYTQQQFWSMNAFLRQVKVRHADRNDPAELLDFDYLGEDGRDPRGLVFYEAPSGLMKAAPPMFLNGREPPVQSGYVGEMQRRELLAQEITHSESFARALVNRLWSQFLGYGFTRPLDDMGPANPPSHPELLNELATEFVRHQYNLKSAMRWIALSEAFQRTSRNVSSTLADMPEAGTPPLFSYYYTRPLQAEEVIRSLQIAAQLRRETSNEGNIAQARIDWLAQYQRTLAKESDDTPPAARLVPSGIMKQATSPGYEGLLQGVLQAKLPFAAKVEHLFLAALSRRPTKQELAAAKKLAGISGMNETAALEDVWWALLNSSEFLLDH